MGTSALFYASSTFLGQFQPTERINLPLSSFAWVADLRVGVERPAHPEMADLDRTLAMSPTIAPITAAPKTISVKRVIRKARITRDRLEITTAAALPAPAAPVAVNTQTVSEHEKFQEMHQALRARFLASVQLDVAPPMPSTASLTTQEVVQVKAAFRKLGRKMTTHKKARAVLVAKIEKPVLAEKPKKVAAATAEPSDYPLISKVEGTRAELVQENPRKLDAVSPVSVASIAPDSLTPSLSTMMAGTASQNPADIDLNQLQAKLAAMMEAAPAPMANPAAQSAPMVIQGAVSSQQQEHEQDRLASRQAQAVVNTQGNSVVSEYSTFVEAFEWKSSILSVTVEPMTVESTSSGWILAQATQHWPTLARKATAPIALLSWNNAKLLAQAAGAELQGGAGIVFGQIEEGWTVEFLGRSERGVMLTADNLPVTFGSTEGTRYFAFVNAAPGAQQVRFENRQTREAGVASILVLPGTASQIDLTQIVRRTIKGRVFDASSPQAKAVSKAWVRVVGLEKSETLAGADGNFEIPGVLTAGDYPVYLETDSEGGFTHRYQYSPRELAHLALFRLGEEQIQDFLGQLQGGISPESGLVVAAPPAHVIGQEGRDATYPAIQELLSNATLTPEVYSVASSGQLMVHSPLEIERPRILGVQVPDGPARVEVNSRDGKPVWSQITVASPRVISMVGPN